MKNPRSILAVRNDRFGEFLLAIPAFKALKKIFPGSRLTLLVHPNINEIARCIEGVDDVLVWSNAKHSLREKCALVHSLRSKKFDVCIIFNPTKELHAISYFAGIPLRVGYDRKAGFFLNRKIRDDKFRGIKHEVDYNLDLVKSIGVDTDDIRLSLSVDDDIIKSLEGVLGKDFITIHPWVSDPVKQWPYERFAALIEKLIASGQRVIVVGGKEESLQSPVHFKQNLGAYLDLTGKTSIPQLAAVLKKSKLLVSGDSGPVHLASCVGTSVIALFRDDMPGKTFKRWGPYGVKNIVVHKNDIREITVNEVFEAVQRILKT